MIEIRYLRASVVDHSQLIAIGTSRPKAASQRKYKKQSAALPAQVDNHRKGWMQQKVFRED